MSDFFGNMLMEGIDFGAKYFKYKQSEKDDNPFLQPDDKSKGKQFINSLIKQNNSLVAQSTKINPLRDQIRRADAVGIPISKLKDADKKYEDLDNWIGIFNNGR